MKEIGVGFLAIFVPLCVFITILCKDTIITNPILLYINYIGIFVIGVVILFLIGCVLYAIGKHIIGE